MGRRITRKQLKQDEFVSTIDTWVHWILANWRPILAALGGVLLVALLWWAAANWSGDRSAEASDLLRQAVASFEGDAAPGSDQPLGDIAAAEAQLQQVVERYGRTDQADVARLYLARLQLARGESESARQTLVRLVDEHRGDALGHTAALDLVRLRVASGQATEVIVDLQAMVAGADRSLPKDVALYELGLVYERERQTGQAREAWQKLLDEFPDSPYLTSASQRLGELG